MKFKSSEGLLDEIVQFSGDRTAKEIPKNVFKVFKEEDSELDILTLFSMVASTPTYKENFKILNESILNSKSIDGLGLSKEIKDTLFEISIQSNYKLSEKIFDLIKTYSSSKLLYSVLTGTKQIASQFYVEINKQEKIVENWSNLLISDDIKSGLEQNSASEQIIKTGARILVTSDFNLYNLKPVFRTLTKYSPTETTRLISKLNELIISRDTDLLSSYLYHLSRKDVNYNKNI